MGVFFTGNLGYVKPDPGECNWDQYWYKNQDVKDIVGKVLLTTNRVTSGLTITDGGGLIAANASGGARVNSVDYVISSGNTVLTAAGVGETFATNFVYVDSVGSIQASTTIPSGQFIPLAVIDVDQTSILRIHDLRPQELPQQAGGGGGLTWSVVTTNKTAITDEGYLMDTTSGALTLTLIASPEIGDQVGVKDYGQSFDTFAVTVDPGTEKIEGNAAGEVMTLDSQGYAGTFVYSGTTYGWLLVTSTPVPIVTSKPLMHVQDQKASGTNGGASIAGYNDRVLNTVVKNEIPGASLASNVLTLPAGEYYFECSSPVYTTSASIAARQFIRNSADSSNLIVGNNDQAYYGNKCMVSGQITLTQTTSIKTTTYMSGAHATGLGIADSQAPYEVYTDLRVWRIDIDIEKPKAVQPVNEPIAGAVMEGGIFGGELIYETGTAFGTNAVSCMDDSNTVPMSLAATTGNSLGSPLASTIYHVFICKHTDESFTIEWDTDINGSGLLATVQYKRWLGYLLTSSGNVILPFNMQGNVIDWYSPITVSTGLGTTLTLVSLTAFLPPTRVKEVAMSGYNSTSSYLSMSFDGTNKIASCQISTITYDRMRLSYASSLYFASNNTGTSVYLVGVFLRR